MSLLKFYVIDTESSGLKTFYHELNQISIIRFEDKFQKTVNIAIDHPERADKRALEIQKKTIHDLKKGIKKEEAVEIIHNFIESDGLTPEHRVVCAHNENFDRRFLHALWETVGKIFPINNFLCTKEFTRKFSKRQGIVKPKLNLEASLTLVGLKSTAGIAHNAVVDSMNACNLFEKLMNENLGHLSLIKNIPHKKIQNNTVDEEIFEDF